MNQSSTIFAYILVCFCILSSFAGTNATAKAYVDSPSYNLPGRRNLLDPDIAISYDRELFRHSVAIDSPDGAFIALIGIGIKYWEKQEYANMRAYSQAAIPWAARSTQKDAVAWCYNNMGESYYYEGDYLKSSEYLYIALRELKKATAEPNHTGANIYNALGRINIRLSQPGKALAFWAIGEDIARKGNCWFQLGENYTERGAYYNSIHKPDSARKYFQQVMAIGKKINKLDLESIANCNLGKTAIEAGDYKLAVTYLQHAIELANGIYDYIVIDASYALGEAYYHQQRYEQAQEVLVSALQQTRAHNIQDRYIEGYTKLAAVYKAMGMDKQALECMDSLVSIKDKLSGIEKATAYNQLELSYKTAEKDKRIAQNELLIAKQQSKIIQKNAWIWGIAISLVFLTVLVVVISRSARQKQRLQAEQIKSLQQENKIGTLRAVVQGEENERGRLARELHDGIGGMLAAAMMRFRAIRHSNEDATKEPAYNEAMQLLDQMGDEIRKTAHNLMPEVLQKQDLVGAVRTFCRNMQEDGVLQVDFQSYGPFDKVPQDVKLNIYRILQELVKNIKQHAHASHALVQMVMNEQTLAITVEDNGIGFDTTVVNEGIGLNNIATRVRSLGGNYTIESEKGKGTTVYIEFDAQQVTMNHSL